MISSIFNLTAELVTPIGTPTDQAKSKMKRHPATTETNVGSKSNVSTAGW